MTSSNLEPRAVARWRAIVALLAVSIVAGIVAVQCANPSGTAGLTPTSPSSSPTPTDGAPAAQLCNATQPSDRFSLVHGRITYSDGSEIWAVDPNHPADRIFLGPSNGLTSMAWSLDGSRLLLLQQRGTAADSKQDLCVMNADGSQTRLTSDGGSGEGSFSPDGTQVVFARIDDGLYVTDLKGATPRLIAKSYLAWWLESPAWSPDGSRIAYMVYLEGGPDGLTYQIWTVNPDGTRPRRLVDLGECGGGGCSAGLAWSPDSSMLAFHSMRDNLSTRTRAIYVVHADGTGLRRINDHGVFPSWSPDGSRIAFTELVSALSSGTDISQNGEIFTMGPDGSNVRHVEGAVVMPPYLRALSWNPVVRT
jgi:Tol biopolymer transport system component